MKPAEKEQKRTPPVIAWRTMQSFFRSLSQGIPSRIDRSVMRSQSGAGQTQIMHALKYLGCIKDDGTTTEKLAQLVKSEGAEHQKVLRDVLTASYSFLNDPSFNLKSATHDQLAERFKEVASGDTVRKCMTFFIPAAREAGFEMSPFIRDIGKRAPSNGKPRKARVQKSTTNETGPAVTTTTTATSSNPTGNLSWHELLLSKFPSFDPSWPDDVKKKWFESFADLMSRGPAK